MGQNMKKNSRMFHVLHCPLLQDSYLLQNVPNVLKMPRRYMGCYEAMIPTQHTFNAI